MKSWRPEGWEMPISITFYNGDAAYEMGADAILEALKKTAPYVPPVTKEGHAFRGGWLVFIPEG
jgi:hypothetical protein